MKQKMTVYLSALVFVSMLFACESSYTPPHELYRADFDPKLVQEVESLLDIIAKKRKLRLYRKDRKQMKFLSQNRDAFFTCFYYRDNCILSVSTVGTATRITIMSIDHGKYSISELESLTKKIAYGIQEITGVIFKLDQEVSSPSRTPQKTRRSLTRR